MSIRTIKSVSLLFCVFFMLFLLSCADFLNDPDLQKDPNRPGDITADQLFNGIQAATFFAHEGQVNRVLSIWMQQLTGIGRSFLGFSQYCHTEVDFSLEFGNIYARGGLVDIRKLIDKLDENGWVTYRGIAKFYEALRIGMAASLWGDLPYSETSSEGNSAQLDEQIAIYERCQSLLDEAIADLKSENTGSFPSNDYVYQGNVNKWVAACYSLKARYYLHWAEANDENYNLAKLAAENGISSYEDNFQTFHLDELFSGNLWSQFLQGWAGGDIVAGQHLVNILKIRQDPRLGLFFSMNSEGEYVGADPNNTVVNASTLNTEFISRSFSNDILSWEETRLILAECLFKMSDELSAVQALNAARRGIEDRWNFAPDTLGLANGLSGEELINSIMQEKYIALFLNVEIFNDWKRTNRPSLQTYGDNSIPRRLHYGINERENNSSISPPDQQSARNDNDPGDVY